MSAAVNPLAAHLAWAIAHIEKVTCTHESTHRGGVLWTICDGCGMTWADDMGGFKPYVEAPKLTAARAALEALPPKPGMADGSPADPAEYGVIAINATVPPSQDTQPDAIDSEPEHVKAVAILGAALKVLAEGMGVVLTIDQRPLQPPAMGHYETLVSVRPARVKS